MTKNRTVKPGVNPNYFVCEDGKMLRPPKGWSLLPPGDAAVTKKVKALGPTWVIQEKRGRRVYSKGVLAPKGNIEIAKESVEAKRKDPAYQKQLQASRQRRAVKQEQYVEDFTQSVFEFLNFHQKYEDFAKKMSEQISKHATPVGSGTVARTERIPIEERAERAVIAWMRHKTTAYDNMKIARVKGRRREVRRELAKVSRQILQSYRSGREIVPNCPLAGSLR